MNHTMSILDRTGDTRMSWTEGDEKATDLARSTFERFVNAGYLAASMDTPTEGRAIREFDPKALEIVLTPAVVAG